MLTSIACIFWMWSLSLRFQAGETIGAISNPTIVELCRQISVETDWNPPPIKPGGESVLSSGKNAPLAQTDFANYYVATVTGYWMKTEDDTGRYIGPFAGYLDGDIGFSSNSVIRIADKAYAESLAIGREKVTACGILEIPRHLDHAEPMARGQRFVWSALG